MKIPQTLFFSQRAAMIRTEEKMTCSLLPPALRRKDLSLADIRFLTAIPMRLLEGYRSGLYKPGPVEMALLQRLVANLAYYPGSKALERFMDKFRLQLLEPIISREELQRFRSLGEYEARHWALQALCEAHASELDNAIVERAKRTWSYDPFSR
jgi:hypothetical protein